MFRLLGKWLLQTTKHPRQFRHIATLCRLYGMFSQPITQDKTRIDRPHRLLPLGIVGLLLLQALPPILQPRCQALRITA